MQVRRVKGSKSFGRRRPKLEAAGQSEDERPASQGLLVWTLRVTVVIGLVSVAGAAQLARWNKLGDGPARMAGRVIPMPVDPETTGTITGAAQAARGTRLDPCRVPAAPPAAEHLRR